MPWRPQAATPDTSPLFAPPSTRRLCRALWGFVPRRPTALERWPTSAAPAEAPTERQVIVPARKHGRVTWDKKYET